MHTEFLIFLSASIKCYILLEMYSFHPYFQIIAIRVSIKAFTISLFFFVSSASSLTSYFSFLFFYIFVFYIIFSLNNLSGAVPILLAF